jgi:hypothetical protein
MNCRYCNGSKKCRKCKGTGIIKEGIISKKESPCGQCKQTGTCGFCKGTGKIDMGKIGRGETPLPILCPKCENINFIVWKKRPIAFKCEKCKGPMKLNHLPKY